MRVEENQDIGSLGLLSKIEEDNKWLQQHYNELQEKYPNRFVAIHNKKVVATAKEMDEIIKTVKKEGLDPASMLIEPIPEKGLTFIL